MTNLRPIRSITNADVDDVIRQVLQGRVNPDSVNDFLASVDWTGTNVERPVIADLLGQLEEWSTAFSEGALSQVQYAARLQSVLPLNERAGGKVTVTLARLGPRPLGVPLLRVLRGQFGQPPQTGSGAPPRTDESKSDIALAV